MDITRIIDWIIMSGLLVSIVGVAFKVGKKDEKVDAHNIKLKEHDKDIEELKRNNNDVKAQLASINTNILWIKEKLSKE